MTAPKSILPNLQAIPCTVEGNNCNNQAFEESSITITLRGDDDEEENPRTLFFQLLSLPQNGLLYEETKQLEVGDILVQTDLYPYSKGVKIRYVGNSNFFTEPYLGGIPENRSRHHEIFDFAVVSPMFYPVQGAMVTFRHFPYLKKLLLLI